MTDLTLSEFGRYKDARTLDEALLEEARNLLGPDYHPGRPTRKRAVALCSKVQKRAGRLKERTGRIGF